MPAPVAAPVVMLVRQSSKAAALDDAVETVVLDCVQERGKGRKKRHACEKVRACSKARMRDVEHLGDARRTRLCNTRPKALLRGIDNLLTVFQPDGPSPGLADKYGDRAWTALAPRWAILLCARVRTVSTQIARCPSEVCHRKVRCFEEPSPESSASTDFAARAVHG